MNADLWDAICKKTQELRELGRDAYVSRYGLNPAADSDRIEELYRGRKYLAPDYLATLLDGVAATFHEQSQGEDLNTIKTAIAAAAYGPRRSGPPPQLAHLTTAVTDWSAGGTQRGLERLLVHGAKLPVKANRRPTWIDRWAAAVDVLQYLAQTAYFAREEYTPGVPDRGSRQPHGDILRNLRWIQRNVLHVGEANVDSEEETAQDEVAYAAIIGLSLLDCTCYEGWKDMRLESEAKGRDHCDHHVLDAWNRAAPLNDFVWAAAINSNLPHLGDFRRGILAKHVAWYHNLAVYPVLLCEACGGEIRVDDTCPRCHAADGAGRTNYRLDKKEHRRPSACWRCPKCDKLFFQGRNACPKCGHPPGKKNRPTSVWIRLGREGVIDDQADEERDGPDEIGEQVHLFLSDLGRMPESEIYEILKLRKPFPGYADSLRRFVLGVFVEGLSQVEAADEAGVADEDRTTVWNHTRRLVMCLWKRRFGDDDPRIVEMDP